MQTPFDHGYANPLTEKSMAQILGYTKAMADKEARIARRFPEFFAGEKPKEGGTEKKSPADFMKKG
jgi:hypothetical protein